MKFRIPLNIFAYTSKPTTKPQSGYYFIYPRTDGKLYMLDTFNNEVPVMSTFTINGDTGQLELSGFKEFNIIGDNDGPTSVDINDETITISTNAHTKEESEALLALTTKVHASVLNQAELDAEITEPAEGMVAIVGDTMKRFDGSLWIDIYEDYVKSSELLTLSNLTIFSGSSQYYQINQDVYSRISSIKLRYIANRGLVARAGTLDILGDGTSFYLSEDWQESAPMGLTISYEQVSTDHYVKFSVGNSVTDSCNIIILETLVDTIQI